MKIEYTIESVEGEPGPNLYWKGSPEECLRLANVIHPLGESNDLGESNNIEINLAKEDWVELIGIESLLLRSKTDGRVLLKLEGGKALMELDSEAWRNFCIEMFCISFHRCHNYIDFEGCNFYQDANVVISSEW